MPVAVDFLNFKFLTVGTVKRVELHQRAKFRQNRLNRGRDMAFFSIFEHGGRRHLKFLKFQIFNGGTLKRVELHHRAKFRRNRSNSGRDMAIFRFFKIAATAILDF